MHSESTLLNLEDFESLVSSASFPVIVFDAECRYTFVNEAGASVSRVSRDEHLGRAIEDIAPDTARLTREVVAKVLARGRMETVAMQHGESAGFVASYFPFRSRVDNAPRVGVVCIPARGLRGLSDTPAREGQVVASARDGLREDIASTLGDANIVYESPAMRRVLELARAVARTPATVLVRGESGVGKELVARFVHKMSSRQSGALVKVNCASIPNELFESEFFGHTRGSFTGALRDRVGRFELAHGGTLFLDEVGEIPVAEQAKLLRVIQEGAFERVGEDRTRNVDVRIIAATNRPLERDIEAGRFRCDLYFRLNVFPIDVPPLRERSEDIVPLAAHFIAKYAQRCGRTGFALSAGDRECLLSYHWPGNVRELSNVIERSVILSAGQRLQVRIPDASPASSTMPPCAEPAASAVARPTTLASLRQLEVDMIQEALQASGGRVSGKDGAAERLGLRPSTLRDRIKSLGVRV